MYKTILLLIFLAGCHPQTPSSSSQNLQPSAESKSAVYFETGGAAIADHQTIKHMALWMKRHTDRVVILEGHADDRGGHEYNLQLGDRRARAVMEILLNEGIPENQLIIVSHGKNDPAASGSTEESWAKNRRVEFTVR